jgi:hypothetical protein
VITCPEWWPAPQQQVLLGDWFLTCDDASPKLHGLETTVAKATARSAREIIDDALGDNQWWEWLCFGLVILLVVTGIGTLVMGIIKEKELIVLTGGGVTGLFWPALSFARSFREANIRVRLYELALAMAKTPDEATSVLREALGIPKATQLKQPETTTP